MIRYGTFQRIQITNYQRVFPCPIDIYNAERPEKILIKVFQVNFAEFPIIS